MLRSFLTRFPLRLGTALQAAYVLVMNTGQFRAREVANTAHSYFDTVPASGATSKRVCYAWPTIVAEKRRKRLLASTRRRGTDATEQRDEEEAKQNEQA